MTNRTDAIRAAVDAAAETQRMKIFKLWCKSTDVGEREALHAKASALTGLKAEITKQLRRES